MTGPLPPDPADVTDADRAKAAELLYPGLFADEAMRRHPGQVARVAAALAAERAAVARPVLALAEELDFTAHDEEATRAVAMWEMADRIRRALAGPDRRPVPLPLHRTEAGYPRCATCDGGGCPDCTDPT